MRSLRIVELWVAACFASLACLSFGSEPSIVYSGLSPELVAVPQNLLNLVHTREVQTELDFSSDQLVEWEKGLREIDAIWWPSRILPVVQQRKLIADLEAKVVSNLERLRGIKAVTRLRQIELQSQGSRILARPELAAFLRLDAKQIKRLAELFNENDKRITELGSKKSQSKEDVAKMRSLVDAKKMEPKEALAILTPVQSNRLAPVFGGPFETSNLERIYPFAPELLDSGHWTTDEHPTLESLRGQVVVIHFYAFQCHNCVANFRHYTRWDEALKQKGVRVIGLQTPETASERDPEKVKAASIKEGFQFPVLIDVDSKNWKVWGNTLWPTVYVIDKKGYIRFWWQGELNWQGATIDQKVEAIVEKLLLESD